MWFSTVSANIISPTCQDVNRRIEDVRSPYQLAQLRAVYDVIIEDYGNSSAEGFCRIF